MIKLLVKEWLAHVVMNIYNISRTSVRVNSVLSEIFTMKVDVYQGLILSPFLFTMVIEVLSSNFNTGLL